MSDETGSVEVSAPGGWKAIFHGIDTKIILLTVLLIMFAAFFWVQVQDSRKVDAEARLEYLNQHKITQTLLSTVITNQTMLLTSIKESRTLATEQSGEITYVLTLDQKKREALKLDMPQSLKRKMNER